MFETSNLWFTITVTQQLPAGPGIYPSVMRWKLYDQIYNQDRLTSLFLPNWHQRARLQHTIIRVRSVALTLQCHHNGHDGVSNHQPHHCLLYRLFGRRSKKTSKLRVTVRGIHRGPVNSLNKWPVTRKMFPFDDIIMETWDMTAFIPHGDARCYGNMYESVYVYYFV